MIAGNYCPAPTLPKSFGFGEGVPPKVPKWFNDNHWYLSQEFDYNNYRLAGLQEALSSTGLLTIMKKSRKTPLSEIKENKYLNIFNAVHDGLILIDLETGRVVDANPAACAMHSCTSDEFIGLLPTDFIHPDSQKVFRDFVQMIRSGVDHDKLMRHACRNGTTFHSEWHGSLFTFQGRSYLLGVVRDVSRRIRAEKRLQLQFEASMREQSTLLEISHSLASTLELQPELILNQLQEIIEFTHAGFFKLDESTLTALTVNGLQKLERAVPFQVRVEGPEILESLFNGHQPIRIADVNSADPEAVLLRLLLKGDAAVFLKGVQAWMWVPVAVKNRIIGGIGVAHKKKGVFHGSPCSPGSFDGRPGRDYHGQFRNI